MWEERKEKEREIEERSGSQKGGNYEKSATWFVDVTYIHNRVMG